MSSEAPEAGSSKAAALAQLLRRVADETALNETALIRRSHASYLICRLQNHLWGTGPTPGGVAHASVSLSERRDTQIGSVANGVRDE
ncbi:hypothetical protein EDE05_101155 [Neorhizobium sp. R1-B]|jgi:hypothetical protein|nr:hypothetical protein EDE09_101455 [Neorhizobium sp. S3-V5DH]TDX88845.1 hypothetical protein EDE05_101155 [Neorhizobium sp. R1-B]